MLRLVTLFLFLINYGLVLASSIYINGWYPCTLTDVSSQPSFDDISFECATVEAPLCHSGICNSSKTIELFIKRKLAVATTQKEEPSTRKSVWFLAGGPGASSSIMEMSMLAIYVMSNYSVDVYTMDHRGTGRSSLLECVAAQATARGSPGGASVVLEELPYCVKDVLHEIEGHTEAFSVTSAAHDLVYLLDVLGDDDASSEMGEVYLYGTSYGTYLVERVMHLAPTQVKGYILDGVVSEAGPTPDTRLLFSHWDQNLLAPSRRFFELCAKQQETCPLQLNIGEYEDILDAVLGIYNEIDEMENDCGLEWMQLTGIDTPSLVMRPFLGLLVRDSSTRTLVPSILGRMRRCNSKDQQELDLVLGPLLDQMIQNAGGITSLEKPNNLKATSKSFFGLSQNSQLTATVAPSIDQLEYLLISYSELWDKPSPSEVELGKLYMNGVFSLGFATLTRYCLLTGNLDPTRSGRDPACSQLSQGLDGISALNFTQSFTYPVDEFYNQTASVPPNTSLLLINGGLDFQTPWEFGRHQFESTVLNDPETSRKMLVEYEFGAHVCGLAATTTDDDTLCGPGIVTSFILNNGDPKAIDTSCMADLPELQLTDDDFSMLVEAIIEAEREQMVGGGFGFGK